MTNACEHRYHTTLSAYLGIPVVRSYVHLCQTETRSYSLSHMYCLSKRSVQMEVDFDCVCRRSLPFRVEFRKPSEYVETVRPVWQLHHSVSKATIRLVEISDDNVLTFGSLDHNSVLAYRWILTHFQFTCGHHKIFTQSVHFHSADAHFQGHCERDVANGDCGTGWNDNMPSLDLGSVHVPQARVQWSSPTLPPTSKLKRAPIGRCGRFSIGTNRRVSDENSTM